MRKPVALSRPMKLRLIEEPPPPVIAEPTKQAIACCAGWLLGHSRIMLSDGEAKRGIFNLCWDFICADRADRADRMLQFTHLMMIEHFVRDAFLREGLHPPTVADFFNSVSRDQPLPSLRASDRSGPA